MSLIQENERLTPNLIKKRFALIQVHHLREGFCGSSGNFHPAFPVESGICSKLAVQVGEEAELGHVVIHNQPFLALSAVAPQYQQVFVSHTAQNFHLYSELHLCLGAPHFQPLHCNLRQRSEFTSWSHPRDIHRIWSKSREYNIQARTIRTRIFHNRNQTEKHHRRFSIETIEVWKAKVWRIVANLGELDPQGCFFFLSFNRNVCFSSDRRRRPSEISFWFFCFQSKLQTGRHGHFHPKDEVAILKTKTPQG